MARRLVNSYRRFGWSWYPHIKRQTVLMKVASNTLRSIYTHKKCMYNSSAAPEKHNLEISVLFSFIGILCSVINTLIMQYFTYNCHNIFIINFPSLITVEFVLFIKSQLTPNVQNILHSDECTQGHVRSWTLELFQRSWGNWQRLERYKKCDVEASLCFQLKLSTIMFLSVPTDKILKDWCWTNVGIYLKN